MFFHGWMKDDIFFSWLLFDRVTKLNLTASAFSDDFNGLFEDRSDIHCGGKLMKKSSNLHHNNWPKSSNNFSTTQNFCLEILKFHSFCDIYLLHLRWWNFKKLYKVERSWNFFNNQWSNFSWTFTKTSRFSEKFMVRNFSFSSLLTLDYEKNFSLFFMSSVMTSLSRVVWTTNLLKIKKIPIVTFFEWHFFFLGKYIK